jgi:predicted ATPase
MLASRRKEIHEKIGNAIENIYVDRLPEFYEVVSYHYYQSGNLERCIEYSTKAAKKAQRAGSIQEAIEQTEMRMACLEKMHMTEIVQKKIIDVRITLARLFTSL